MNYCPTTCRNGEARVMRKLVLQYAALALAALLASTPALAQKRGGVLRIFQYDSPASMSIHEEALNSAQNPAMAVFNNLVLFKQDEPQNRIDAIVPELAVKWAWNGDTTALTFQLRRGVSWHDGKPFTAADVKCTWDLILGKGTDKLRANPRKAWYRNLEAISTKSDTVTFHLKRPQPAFIALLASGFSPVYPCHVPPQVMRKHPIGTGPFKFVEFKPNEHIKIIRNQDYWKKGRPYLDAIEYTILRNRSTAMLAFSAGKFDITSPYDVTIPLLKDVKSQMPQAVCELAPTNVSRNLLVYHNMPPFDNAELRHAMALTLDRQAFITILTEGQGNIGGVMEPSPEGQWGLPLIS